MVNRVQLISFNIRFPAKNLAVLNNYATYILYIKHVYSKYTHFLAGVYRSFVSSCVVFHRKKHFSPIFSLEKMARRPLKTEFFIEKYIYAISRRFLGIEKVSCIASCIFLGVEKVSCTTVNKFLSTEKVLRTVTRRFLAIEKVPRTVACRFLNVEKVIFTDADVFLATETGCRCSVEGEILHALANCNSKREINSLINKK